MEQTNKIKPQHFTVMFNRVKLELKKKQKNTTEQCYESILDFEWDHNERNQHIPREKRVQLKVDSWQNTLKCILVLTFTTRLISTPGSVSLTPSHNRALNFVSSIARKRYGMWVSCRESWHGTMIWKYWLAAVDGFKRREQASKQENSTPKHCQQSITARTVVRWQYYRQYAIICPCLSA